MRVPPIKLLEPIIEGALEKGRVLFLLIINIYAELHALSERDYEGSCMPSLREIMKGTQPHWVCAVCIIVQDGHAGM